MNSPKTNKSRKSLRPKTHPLYLSIKNELASHFFFLPWKPKHNEKAKGAHSKTINVILVKKVRFFVGVAPAPPTPPHIFCRPPASMENPWKINGKSIDFPKIMNLKDSTIRWDRMLEARGLFRCRICFRSILSRQNGLNRHMEQNICFWPKIQFFSFSAYWSPIETL